MPALCDFLEDSASVSDSAVLPSGDCGWTWFEVDQEPWPVNCVQCSMGLTDVLAVGHSPDMKIDTESPSAQCTVWGFPQIDSAAVGCGAVELDDLTFRRTSFPPDEFSAGRECDYIWLAPLASSSVCVRMVTGSLLFGSSHRLARSCLCSAVISLHWMESADVPQCRHLQTAVGCSMPDICIPG